MRKFKRKNRQKRKYTRHTPAAPSFSLSRPVWIGLIPSILIAIALLTTFIITTGAQEDALQVLNRQALSPAELLHSLADNLMQTIAGAQQNFTPPALPNLEIHPLQFSLTWLSSLGQGISFMFETVWNGLLHVLSVLNPVPVISGLGRVIVSVLSAAGHGVAWTGGIMISVGAGLLSVITYAAVVTGHAFVTAFQAVGNGILFVFTVLSAVIITIAQGIINIFLAIAHTIAGVFTAIFNFLAIPFVALHSYYIEIRPFLLYVGTLFQHSANDLAFGLNNLLNLPKELSQNAVH